MHNTISWWSTLAVAALLTAGVTHAQQTGTTGTGQQSPGASQVTRGARDFVNKMTIAGLAEVQLGKMASERASNADVKAFGQMMVKDHTQANQELAQVASQLNLKPPAQLDKKHQELADKLSRLEGVEFDREYMQAMVDGHEDVVNELRRRAGSATTSPRPGGTSTGTTAGGTGQPGASGAGTVGTAGDRAMDPALTKWAAKTLPVVQQHLERAREIEKGLK